MMNRFGPYSRRFRSGVTLIEIVVGLVVLAVLVSSITVARGRFMRQWSEAERGVQAAKAVDRMLAGWIGNADADSIPVPSAGNLDGVEGCVWRTNWVSDPSATRIGAGVVRVEVLQGGKRVLAVDVLKHLRTRAEAEVGR